MAKNLDLKLIVKHLINGTLGDKLCRICLQPLMDLYENIFTKICTLDEEYCIADVLKELCDIEFTDSDHYNVCSTCFVFASNAYKFYLNLRRCDDVLHILTDKLQESLDSIPDIENHDSLFISLPPVTSGLSFNINNPEKVCVEKEEKRNNPTLTKSKTEKVNSVKKTKDTRKLPKDLQEDDEDLVIVMNETGLPSFYKMQPDGSLVEVEYDDRCRRAYQVITERMPRRKSKKRGPMSWKQCSQCPIAYRFVSKLRDHMWAEHDIMLFTCKVCGVFVEGADDFQFHIKTHTNVYECDICNSVFKKRNTIITHLQFHDKMIDIANDDLNYYVCADCGAICRDVESYNAHVEQHNTKNYTCYYCGRMYKKEVGFNNHIKKHEMYHRIYEIRHPAGKQAKVKQEYKKEPVKREFTCELCGRSFLGRRALLWHSRLHTNERPFTCDICKRGFVSLNRRNQHSLCAHTAPSRQCPLCPALFHMRSMVNSHIKKVHLKTHKRRSRAVRARDVSWPTAPVPVQELSVALQHHILELQAEQDDVPYAYEGE